MKFTWNLARKQIKRGLKKSQHRIIQGVRFSEEVDCKDKGLFLYFENRMLISLTIVEEFYFFGNPRQPIDLFFALLIIFQIIYFHCWQPHQ